MPGAAEASSGGLERKLATTTSKVVSKMTAKASEVRNE